MSTTESGRKAQCNRRVERLSIFKLHWDHWSQATHHETHKKDPAMKITTFTNDGYQEALDFPTSPWRVPRVWKGTKDPLVWQIGRSTSNFRRRSVSRTAWTQLNHHFLIIIKSGLWYELHSWKGSHGASLLFHQDGRTFHFECNDRGEIPIFS